MRSEGRRRGAETWSFCFSHNGILIFSPHVQSGEKRQQIFSSSSPFLSGTCVYFVWHALTYTTAEGENFLGFKGKKKLRKGGTGGNNFDFFEGDPCVVISVY